MAVIRGPRAKQINTGTQAAGSPIQADGSGGTQFGVPSSGAAAGILPEPSINSASVEGLFGAIGDSVPDAQPGDARVVGVSDQSIATSAGTYYDSLAVELLDELYPDP